MDPDPSKMLTESVKSFINTAMMLEKSRKKEDRA